MVLTRHRGNSLTKDVREYRGGKIGGKDERRQEGREEVRQKSRVQLLQGTPNQGYALRGRGPPDKR